MVNPVGVMEEKVQEIARWFPYAKHQPVAYFSIRISRVVLLRLHEKVVRQLQRRFIGISLEFRELPPQALLLRSPQQSIDATRPETLPHDSDALLCQMMADCHEPSSASKWTNVAVR